MEDHPADIFEDEQLVADIQPYREQLAKRDAYLLERPSEPGVQLKAIERFVLYQRKHRVAVRAGEAAVAGVGGVLVGAFSIKALRGRLAH